jgi:hypothetical protein
MLFTNGFLAFLKLIFGLPEPPKLQQYSRLKVDMRLPREHFWIFLIFLRGGIFLIVKEPYFSSKKTVFRV